MNYAVQINERLCMELQINYLLDISFILTVHCIHKKHSRVKMCSKHELFWGVGFRLSNGDGVENGCAAKKRTYHCPTWAIGDGQRIRLDDSSGRLCTIVRRGQQRKDKGYASMVAADDYVPLSAVGHRGRTKDTPRR